MGYSDLNCYGGHFVPTPNIDRLAQEGVRFTHFYNNAPVCSPSRAAFITGAFPARWNFTTYLYTPAQNLDCEQTDFLPPSAPSLARALKAAGYATAHFGKWHLGGGHGVTNAPPFSAFGFDEHIGTYQSPDPDPNLTATNWTGAPTTRSSAGIARATLWITRWIFSAATGTSPALLRFGPMTSILPGFRILSGRRRNRNRS